MTSAKVVRRIPPGCPEHCQHNVAGLLASDAPEFIHLARVALHRPYSAIKLFAPVLPSEFVAAYGQT